MTDNKEYYLITCLLLIIFALFPYAVECKEKKPNLVLVTIDTLRADHLHAYGYERKTSPNLDRLAAEGVLFENAFTVSPRTTQSVASIITGRYPQTIGVRALWGRLKPNEGTLAEVLKQNGYYTGGVFSNPIIAKSNIDHGFDFFFIPIKIDMTKAVKVNKTLFSLLQRKLNRPVFIWIHYWDPHESYNPPKEYKDLFNPGYWGAFKQKFNFYWNLDNEKIKKHELYKPRVVFNHTPLPQKDIKQISALYDGEIAYTDMAVGELLEGLKERGFMKNTLVVVTSDHGESLGEHQFFFDHGDFVYDATVRVPLIFHWSGIIPPGRRVSRSVRTIDIFPTILSLMGIPDTFGKREGKDLTPMLLGKKDLGDLPVYIESGECLFLKFNSRRYIKGVKGKIRGLREGNWKLILTPTKSEPIFELYNLDTDPSETQDLAAKEPKRVQEMFQRLKEWFKKGNKKIIREKNKEIKKSLRSVGYLQ
jgi:arylsulfatase A-like enzyme